MSMLTANDLHEIVGFDYVSKHKGIFKVYQSYFYRKGRNETHLVEAVSQCLNKSNIQFEIVNSGDHYAEFKGGAPIQKQSHWWVRFKIID